MPPETTPETTIRQRRTLRDYILIGLRGVAMGASDIVPGVSGGTMALILGIYEELIESIRDVARPEVFKAALRFDVRELLRLINWPFLLAVAVGILTAIFTLSRGLEWLFANQPVLLWSFFFGLVLASVITVSKRLRRWTPTMFLILAVGAVAAFLLIGVVPVSTPETWWFIFLSGALAICAMILPGVSGAFILVILGKYQFVLSAVNDGNFAVILLVLLGAVVGLLTFAQLLGWLFRRYHDRTVALLTGLMLGSLRKVWPWKIDVDWMRDAAGKFVVDHSGAKIVTSQNNILPPLESQSDITQVGIAFALTVAGFAAILLLTRLVGPANEGSK